ncbi:MAG: type 4 pilus major pilin, partial [Pseudomonadota bacterium]|nr:type 4 pilus major pilin [Pseudomonadota bacterium]
IAFILIGGLTLFNRAQDVANIQRAQQQILALTASVKQLYAATPNYVGLSNAVLINANAVPSDMLSAGAIVNIFAGAVTIGPGTGCNGTTGDFCITFQNVPDSACTQLVTGGGSGGFQEVKPNTGNWMIAPVSPDQAALRCNAGRSNTIIWLI